MEYKNQLDSPPKEYYPIVKVCTDDYGGPSMAGIGSIRTKQKCPKCKGRYGYGGLNSGLVCKKCLTHPTSYFIDLYWKGKRLRLFSDRSERSLKSFTDAFNLKTVINSEIANKKFDSDRYIKKKQ